MCRYVLPPGIKRLTKKLNTNQDSIKSEILYKTQVPLQSSGIQIFKNFGVTGVNHGNHKLFGKCK